MTKPHRRLMHLLDELGLEVESEARVGRYSLDVFCSEVWLGFEADGRKVHSGVKKRAKDDERDRWIFENAGIPVLRVDEQALRKTVWEETKKRVREFIDAYSGDLQVRREKGSWTGL